jgi:hypothetical protein
MARRPRVAKLAICAIFLPMIFYGKKLRGMKRESYWKEVKLRKE